MRNKHLYLRLILEQMMYPSSILEGKIKSIYRNDIQNSGFLCKLILIQIEVFNTFLHLDNGYITWAVFNESHNCLKLKQ